MRIPPLRSSVPFRRRIEGVVWRLRTDLWVRPCLLDERWVDPGALRRIVELLDASPLVVLDLGSRGGVRYLRDLRRLTRVFGFEPNEEQCRPLSQEWHVAGYREAKFFPAAIWSASGTRRLVVTRSPGSISFFRANRALVNGYAVIPDMFEVIGEADVPTISLDEFAEHEDLAYVDFVKMDVQGSELEAIRGGKRIFDSALVVVTEVWFSAVYEGGPVFRDIDHALARSGLALLAVEHVDYPAVLSRSVVPSNVGDKGQWVWGDGVYVRDVFGHPDAFPFRDPTRAIKALLVLESLGYVGSALEIAALYQARGLPEAELVQAVASAIVTRNRLRWYEQTPLARGPGRRAVRRLLGREPHGGRANFV